MACHARREGDEMTCVRCNLRWPTTEDAPACLPLEEALRAPRKAPTWRQDHDATVDAQLRRAREFMQPRNAVDLLPLVRLVEHQMRMGPFGSTTQQLLEIMVAAFLTDRDKVK